MSAIHVNVRPLPERAPSSVLAPLYGFFDVVVDGVNVTARIGEGQALALLCELGHAVAGLCSGRRDRATVQLYTDEATWELGLEAVDSDVLLTVFKGGANPEVAVHERRVTLSALREAVVAAIAEAPSMRGPHLLTTSLAAASRALDVSWPPAPRSTPARSEEQLGGRGVRGIVFSARAGLRCTSALAGCPEIERADLHALLVEGELEVAVRGRSVVLGRLHLFLFTEQLVHMAHEVVEAWRSGRPVFRRIEQNSALCGVRRGPGEAPLSLTLSGARQRVDERVTFPEIDPSAFVQAVLRFARSLLQAITSHDASQVQNLRVSALSASLGELSERAAEGGVDDALTNPEPDSYRSFPLPRRTPELTGVWEHGGRMRFLPRWVATVPSIDLSSTFLCGERLVIGSARETAAIDRTTGAVLWRLSTVRAATVATPYGLARMHPEGRVTLHDLDNGQPRWSVPLAPRAAGGASGAVVHSPGLPKLLIVAEGDRRVTAIDLGSGDVRWRYTARRPAGYRVRRAGRLLLVAGGDTSLVALDVVSGELVWRACDRLPFTGDVVVDHDAAFAIGGVPSGPARLHHVDPFSGELRWTAELEDRAVPGAGPLVTPDVIVVPTRDRRGVGAAAFDRATGEPLWTQAPGLAGPTTAWLAIDDALIANSASGVLLCLDAKTGVSRYSHVFSRHVDADQPRRLEPVLRSGALFVPQHQVHVMRPRDGEVIGQVPTDLIPDLLRVDERCDVYVAEESGHLAAFGVASRLTLVKS